MFYKSEPEGRFYTLSNTGPKTFINDILSPEFQALNGALVTYLNEITEKLIKEEIYHDVSEPSDIKGLPAEIINL